MARYATVDNIPCGCGAVTENPLLKYNDDIIGKTVNDILSGKMIQNAAPFLSIQERELLISGTCLKCQKVLFRPPKKRRK